MSPSIDTILAIDDPTQFAIALSNHVYGKGGEGVADLTEAELTVFCIDGLERDVNNGGFSQWFFNSAGDQARETVDALERVGASHTAGLVRRSLEPFGPDGPSRDWEARRDQLEEIGEGADTLWDELTDAFCAYTEDLTSLLRGYVSSHRGQFTD